jgi:hypothetical protein
MTRNVMRAMDYDTATVTTGVAADLICGETHIRGCTIPTQKKITKLYPTYIHHQSVQKKRAFVHHFAQKFQVIFEEDSMTGRQCVLQGGYRYLPPMVTYTNYQQLVKNVYSIMCLVNLGLQMQRDATHFGFFAS